jgi:hypothetical protein
MYNIRQGFANNYGLPPSQPTVRLESQVVANPHQYNEPNVRWAVCSISEQLANPQPGQPSYSDYEYAYAGSFIIKDSGLTEDQYVKGVRCILKYAGLSQADYLAALKYIICHESLFTEAEYVQAIRYIKQHENDFTCDENLHMSRHVILHDSSYTGLERASAIKFIIQYLNHYTQQHQTYPTIILAEVNFIAQKLIEYYDDTQHDITDCITLAAQIFITTHIDFFTASRDDVLQFVSYAANKAGAVNEYRDALFDKICALNLEEQGLALWREGNFVKAPELSIEIALFILEKVDHEVFTLWNNFVQSKMGSPQLTGSSSYYK